MPYQNQLQNLILSLDRDELNKVINGTTVDDYKFLLRGFTSGKSAKEIRENFVEEGRGDVTKFHFQSSRFRKKILDILIHATESPQNDHAISIQRISLLVQKALYKQALRAIKGALKAAQKHGDHSGILEIMREMREVILRSDEVNKAEQKAFWVIEQEARANQTLRLQLEDLFNSLVPIADREELRSILEESPLIHERPQSKRCQITWYRVRILILRRLNRHLEAVPDLEALVGIYQDKNLILDSRDTGIYIRSLHNLGNLYMINQPDKALPLVEKLKEAAKKSKALEIRIWNLELAAMLVYGDLRKLKKMVGKVMENLKSMQGIFNPEQISILRFELLFYHLCAGKLEEAEHWALNLSLSKSPRMDLIGFGKWMHILLHALNTKIWPTQDEVHLTRRWLKRNLHHHEYERGILKVIATKKNWRGSPIPHLVEYLDHFEPIIRAEKDNYFPLLEWLRVRQSGNEVFFEGYRAWFFNQVR